MPRSVHEEYEQRREQFRAEARHVGRWDGWIALLRGILFLTIGLLGLTWLFAGGPSPIWLLIPGMAYAAAVIAHERVLVRQRRAQRGVEFYNRCLERLAGRWSGTGSSGDRYNDATHPYAGDLDLFGTGSVFQLLWRSATRLGEDRLAAWLLQPADRSVILSRQEAVSELQPRYDLREAVGLLDAGDFAGNQNLLRAWAGVPARPVPVAMRGTAAVLALAFWSGFLLWLGGFAPVSLPIAAYAGCMVLAFLFRRRITDAAGRLHQAEAGLTPLAEVLRLAEREEFQSPLLRQIPARLASDGLPCSQRIASLHQLSHWFDATLSNQFFAPLALTLGLPVHLAHAAERWRDRFGGVVPAWLDAVGEFEALLSLSGYAAEHPDDCWPEISTGGPSLVARGLGHPLLPHKHCVRNDVAIGDPVRLLVVSGSNMAGKSTLLRAIGVNAVLAYTGAPVRADSLTLPVLQVGTVIRVVDSLQTGKSLFFAGIERLKRVTALADGPRPLLFLLDELLAGTNSHDRRIGAEAVLQWLVSAGAIGIVTTHDLALTEIADAWAPAAENRHFRDELIGDRLQFDHTLRPGVVDRGNALALMRLVGLMPNEADGPASTGGLRRDRAEDREGNRVVENDAHQVHERGDQGIRHEGRIHAEPAENER